MTRTVDATLTAALAEGKGIPFIKGYIGYTNGTVLHSQTLISYKLTGQELEFEMAYTGDFASDQECIWLERGLTIAGTDYTVTTGRFRIMSQRYFPNGTQVAKGALFPKEYYSASGYASYQSVINAFCTAYGKTASYRDALAAWLSYKFFPAGKNIIMNDANKIANLLRQKYLIYYCDKGSENVLFYDCGGSLLGGDDFTITPESDYYRELTHLNTRYFIWRDEAGTVHTDGVATNPIHNLGYLESTDSPPARHSPAGIMQVRMRPDLRVMDGDIVAIVHAGVTQRMFALVSEEYAAPDKQHPHPRWQTIITANEVFGNTEGGAAPSTIERVSNYTPLNTSMFTKILSANENNLQAAMDKLDDHQHKAYFPLAMHGMAGVIGAGGTQYLNPFLDGLNVTAYAYVATRAGTVKNLTFRKSGTQPGTGTLVVTVRVNAAGSAITITVPANDVGNNNFQDTTHTVAIVPGDTVDVSIKNNAAAASCGIRACYVEIEAITTPA